MGSSQFTARRLRSLVASWRVCAAYFIVCLLWYILCFYCDAREINYFVVLLQREFISSQILLAKRKIVRNILFCKKKEKPKPFYKKRAKLTQRNVIDVSKAYCWYKAIFLINSAQILPEDQLCPTIKDCTSQPSFLIFAVISWHEFFW